MTQKFRVRMFVPDILLEDSGVEAMLADGVGEPLGEGRMDQGGSLSLRLSLPSRPERFASFVSLHYCFLCKIIFKDKQKYYQPGQGWMAEKIQDESSGWRRRRERWRGRGWRSLRSRRGIGKTTKEVRQQQGPRCVTGPGVGNKTKTKSELK